MLQNENCWGNAGRSAAMTDHAVVIPGAGPTGLMLAGELGVK